MDQYQLAKLVQSAQELSPDGLKSRKRMQKVVFLLKCAGCPVDAGYLLHFYGPYSAEVAQVTDELVHAGLLVEEPTQNQIGKQFNYKLKTGAADSISSFEETAVGVDARNGFARFEKQAKCLLARDLNALEYAATIAYFHERELDWHSAFQRTCEFKRLHPDSDVAKTAQS